MKEVEVLTKEETNKALKRISHEIIEKNEKSELVLLGIKDRGDVLAKRIYKEIKHIANKELPVGSIDITFYRDDFGKSIHQPKSTNIPCDITDKTVILVDDVLFTGRSTKAALDAIIDYGRPAKIQLAVLVDRGHREFPIHADYVGKNIPTSMNDDVQVKLEEIDGEDSVKVCS